MDECHGGDATAHSQSGRPLSTIRRCLPESSPGRSRHCPKCQGTHRAKWLESRTAELLPVEYLHVVFTQTPIARHFAPSQYCMFGVLALTVDQLMQLPE